MSTIKKQSYLRSEFAFRAHSFMLSVEEFEETGKLGNLIPDLFKLFSFCWMKNPSMLLSSRFTEDYKLFKKQRYWRLPSEIQKFNDFYKQYKQLL